MHRHLAMTLALLACACGQDRASATERDRGAEPAAEPETIEEAYAEPVGRIVERSQGSEFAWEWLEHLCVEIGHRISGSESLERAVQWSATELEGIEGVEVTRQPVDVPAWVRGEERLTLLGETEEPLEVVGLGMSVGTPEGGVEGEVVVVDSLEAIDARGDELAGKIVLIDRAMPAYDEAELETGYGETVPIRTQGPARAAAHGALAVLIRSVTADPESPPHTGATRYPDEGPRIPGAAVTVPVAERLHRMADAGEAPRVRLEMGASLREELARSHNVIAELRGAEEPDEIVVFGGHIDSWDVGQGCHDDASGVVSAMATLRILVELGLRPRRTIRAVLFTNEENGLGGARAYAEEHYEDGLHVAGIESDIGAARVIGLTIQTEDVRRGVGLAQIGAIVSLLEPIGLTRAEASFGGADLIPLREHGVPAIGVIHDPAHYFDLHHTAADTIDAVDHDDFLQGVAVMAATTYVVADMEPRLTNPR